jgi:5-(carboxyamino)imidazole ribonucleotide mutase
MGSKSDWETMQETVRELNVLGVTCKAHVSSAHRTPERTVALVRRGEEEGVRVFVCGAGMAAHLAGVVAAHTVRPVIGVPLPGGVGDGLDALLSTVQMPGGVPVATVAIGRAGARNAAYLAAEILAVGDAALARRLVAMRAASAAAVGEADSDLTLPVAGQ